VPGGLTAVDVQRLAADEGRLLEVEDGLPMKIPALLTNVSMRPKRSSVSSTMR
jgi:hypothetical protein